MALILNSVPLIPLLFNVAFVSFSKGLMNTDSANKTNRSGETSNAEGSKNQLCMYLEFLGSLLGTIQVLRHQSGGWVGSENGSF